MVSADLSTSVQIGDGGIPYAVVEHEIAKVTVYLHQSDDDGPVLIVDVDNETDEVDAPTGELRIYLNDTPLHKREK